MTSHTEKEVPFSRFSLYHIGVTKESKKTVLDSRFPYTIITPNQDRGNFNEQEYSLMKYGRGDFASTFGIQLADSYIETYREYILGVPSNSIVVTSAGYKVAPTSSYALREAFFKRLNTFLTSHRKEMAQPLHISLHNPPSGDYGALSKEERIHRLNELVLGVDQKQVTGKHIIVVEDARITGTNEQRIYTLLKKYTPKSIHFVYLVEADEKATETHPTIEDRINHAAFSHMTDIFDLMRRPDFTPNDRMCRAILSKVRSDILEKHLRELISAGFISPLRTLHEMIIGNEYHLVPKYKDNYITLSQCVATKIDQRVPMK